MDRISQALIYVNHVNANTSKIEVEYDFRKAEIFALIAIAEELKKMNEREEEKDKPWEKGLGL